MKLCYPVNPILDIAQDVVNEEVENYADVKCIKKNSEMEWDYVCFNYALAKHYEIPATGSLLIADETNDLKRAGFIADKHYISVNRSNILEKIRSCLRNPKDYEIIRKAGMAFSRKNHSINNRIELFGKILEDLSHEIGE